MRNYDEIKASMERLETDWGDVGKSIVIMCLDDPLNMESWEFLQHCTACGGNRGGMFLTGVKDLRPEIWEAIPDDMGVHAWACICSLLTLLNVNFEEE